jgi:hypothetical protein
VTKKYVLLVALLLVLVLAAGCGTKDPGNTNGGGGPVDPPAVAEFVGSDSCKMCHSAEYGEWEKSWHTIKATKGPAMDAPQNLIYDWVKEQWDDLDTYMIVDQEDNNTILVATEKSKR